MIKITKIVPRIIGNATFSRALKRASDTSSLRLRDSHLNNYWSRSCFWELWLPLVVLIVSSLKKFFLAGFNHFYYTCPHVTLFLFSQTSGTRRVCLIQSWIFFNFFYSSSFSSQLFIFSFKGQYRIDIKQFCLASRFSCFIWNCIFWMFSVLCMLL